MPVESRSAVRARVEDVENLEQYEGSKSKRQRVFFGAGRKTVVEHAKSELTKISGLW